MMKHLKVLSLILASASLCGCFTSCNSGTIEDALSELERIEDYISEHNGLNWSGYEDYGSAYGVYPSKEIPITEDNDIGIMSEHIYDILTNNDPNEGKVSEDASSTESDEIWNYEVEHDYLYTKKRNDDKLYATCVGYGILVDNDKPHNVNASYEYGMKWTAGKTADEIYTYTHLVDDVNEGREYNDKYIFNPDTDDEGNETGDIIAYTTKWEDVRDEFYDYFCGSDNDESVLARIKDATNEHLNNVDNVKIKKSSFSWRFVTNEGGRCTVTFHHDESYKLESLYVDYTRNNTSDGLKREVTARCIYMDIDYKDVDGKMWTQDGLESSNIWIGYY